MKTIQLTQGKFAIVDDEDFDRLMAIGKWQFHHSGYASRTRHGGNRKFISMHRLITDCPARMEVDHLNLDKLDNRKENLRVATKNQNMHNRPVLKNNALGIKGVRKTKKGLFQARLKLFGKIVFNKAFRTPEEAAAARLDAAVKFHGEFAR